METTRARSVRTQDQIRLSFPNRPDVLAAVLKTIRQTGGGLLGHLVFDLPEQAVGLFLCERPTEAILSLQAEGLEPSLEVVVVVETENRWGALSHILKVLETEQIHVGYTYGTSATADLCLVLRTADSERTAAALRRYLILPDPPPQDQG
jgi:hypothetical protein